MVSNGRITQIVRATGEFVSLSHFRFGVSDARRSELVPLCALRNLVGPHERSGGCHVKETTKHEAPPLLKPEAIRILSRGGWLRVYAGDVRTFLVARVWPRQSVSI
jgi:hypothetical protein